MAQDIVVVHGATGMQGRPVVSALLAEGFDVRGVSRSGSQKNLPDGVQAVAADLSDVASLVAAYDGASAVIPVLPGGASQAEAEPHAQNVLDALKTAKVPRAIFNTSGAVWDQPTGLPILDARTRFVSNLAKVVDQAAFIGPVGMYYEVFADDWVVARVKSDGALIGMMPADAPLRPIAMADQAKLMIDTLKGDTDLWGKTTFVSGPEEITGAQFAKAISAQTGRNIEYQNLPPQDYMAAMADGLSPQYAANIAQLYGPGAQIPPPAEPGPSSRVIEGSTGLSAFVASQHWL